MTASPATSKATWGQIAGAVARIGFLPVALLLPAGRLDWVEAWAVSGAYLLWLAVLTPLLLRHDPDLVRERLKASPVQVKAGQFGWDAVLMVGMFLCGLGVLVVPGLDVQRFGWSERLPLGVEIVGFALHPVMMTAIGWVMWANTFLSRVVKVDEDRGHHVITTGPYAIVRHPMYAATILLLLAMPLALGSRWGLVPAVAMALLLVVRTAMEDRTLHEELEGYPEFARKTRYRLVPGLW